MRLFRFFKILSVIRRFGIDDLIVTHEPSGRLKILSGLLRFGRAKNQSPRAVRLREALEALGPIFVKFGQVLSTRRDLLPADIADELTKLQDRVPPFGTEKVHEAIFLAYGKKASEVFAEFNELPEASASVAQVHFAKLPENAGGYEVAVKILRPNIHEVIDHDLGLLSMIGNLLETWLPEASRRFKPREVVIEFSKHLLDELDLMREAANCSQLRRNFKGSPLLLVPEVYWDFCTAKVMVMERMKGVSISERGKLMEAGIDLAELSRAGIEIFFTQVLRDGFFHADMHPGNIFVSIDGANKGKYIALDFGIVGTLSDENKDYLTQNFISIFRRDYLGFARAHIEAGWIPKGTREDEFAAAIRAVCEPLFDRPLAEISFGKVFIRLFQTARRFQMEVQPELILLQKTLLNVEGLGRELNPNMDLWSAARPFLESWIDEQMGVKAVIKSLKKEAPQWAQTLPQLPRLLRQSLSRNPADHLIPILTELTNATKKQTRVMRYFLWIFGVALALAIWLILKSSI